MYDAKCPSELSDKNYIDKGGRHIAEREKDHNRRDHKSHILKHLLETEHELVTSSGVRIISKQKKATNCWVATY